MLVDETLERSESMEKLNVSELHFVHMMWRKRALNGLMIFMMPCDKISFWWKEKISYNYAIFSSILLKKYIRINIIKYVK